LRNARYDYMTQSDLAFLYRSYIGQGDLANPESRLLDADLSTLPRPYVQYGEAEIFHDQVETFCKRALDDRMDISAEKFLEQPHVFHLLSPLTSASRQAMHNIIAFIEGAGAHAAHVLSFSSLV